jgi:excisionase family DNA binding protein
MEHIHIDLSEIPLLSTRAELAKLCHVTDQTIDRWVSEGRIRAKKLGKGKSGRCVFLRDDIKAFLVESSK